jgi:glutaminase
MDGESFVSTGVLPDPERVQALVEEARARFLSNGEGALSAVYPALQQASPDDFGLCVVAVRGAHYATGAAPTSSTRS